MWAEVWDPQASLFSALLTFTRCAKGCDPQAREVHRGKKSSASKENSKFSGFGSLSFNERSTR
jgi:hypothetical protein